jgi:hypothetical protein
MSSSISSSKAGLLAIGFVVATLLLCEIGMRAFEQSISIDVQHLRSIPGIAERLSEGEGKRVLILGSSIVREAVDLDAIQAAVPDSGIEHLTVEKVHPDASRIAEWTHLVRHHFIDTGRSPDVIVVGFADTQLDDNNPVPWDRIAAFYSSGSDLRRILFDDIDDFGTRVQFVLAHYLRSFAHRDRVGKRILDLVVPHYRQSIRRVNEALNEVRQKTAEADEHRYSRLERLADLASENGIMLVFLAMPLRDEWEFRPELSRRMEQMSARVIDGRHIPGIGLQSFRDRLHMNTSGSQRLSGWLAGALVATLDAER